MSWWVGGRGEGVGVELPVAGGRPVLVALTNVVAVAGAATRAVVVVVLVVCQIS